MVVNGCGITRSRYYLPATGTNCSLKCAGVFALPTLSSIVFRDSVQTTKEEEEEEEEEEDGDAPRRERVTDEKDERDVDKGADLPDPGSGLNFN